MILPAFLLAFFLGGVGLALGTAPLWLVCLLIYLDGYSFWAPFQENPQKRKGRS